MDLVQAYSTRREMEFKHSIRRQFLLAELVSRFLTSKKEEELPHPWDYYPDLFADEKKRFDEIDEQEKLEKFKERRRQGVIELNKRHRGL